MVFLRAIKDIITLKIQINIILLKVNIVSVSERRRRADVDSTLNISLYYFLSIFMEIWPFLILVAEVSRNSYKVTHQSNEVTCIAKIKKEGSGL